LWSLRNQWLPHGWTYYLDKLLQCEICGLLASKTVGTLKSMVTDKITSTDLLTGQTWCVDMFANDGSDSLTCHVCLSTGELTGCRESYWAIYWWHLGCHMLTKVIKTETTSRVHRKLPSKDQHHILQQIKSLLNMLLYLQPVCRQPPSNTHAESS
jgi:hypothetical protein